MRTKGNYSLYRRKGKKKSVFYFRTYDSSGRRTPGRSTGQSSKTAAERYVENLLKKGSLPTKGDQTFGKFAENWFVWDKCLYVKQRRQSRGIGRTYVEGQRSYLEHHILPTFQDIRLSAITKEMILAWLHKLPDEQSRMGRPLTKTTVNHCLRILKLMLSEAEDQGYIVRNPSKNISRLKREKKRRVLPTLEEFQKLFDERTIPTVWNGNDTLYTICLLAASTGLRLGEIQALRASDIQNTHIDVAHAWERKYGIKGTKTDKPRFVTTFSRTEKWLKTLVDGRTGLGDECLLFSGKDQTKPLSQRVVLTAFYEALNRIGISEEVRRERDITFHAWRHFFVTSMRPHLPDWKLNKLTGHSSGNMADHYTTLTPEDCKDVREIQEKLFG